MSVTISNCHQICNSPTNASKAKMLYSFSKSCRFPSKKKFNCDKFYNIPKVQARATSLGFGHKYDFTKQVSKSPPPNAYEIKSDFEEGEMKGKSFGEGREQMKITGPFVKSHKNKNPGPGTYNSLSTLNKISYSMNGKNVKQDKQKLKLPGPGAYEPLFSLNQKGKYFLAKHKSSCVRNFNDSVKRQFDFQTLAPGPGKYDTSKQDLSPQGHYVMSRMPNTFVRRFGTSCRQSLAPKVLTPGPGNYTLPSQFGHYLSKTAHRAERDKLINSQSLGQKENEKSGTPRS